MYTICREICRFSAERNDVEQMYTSVQRVQAVIVWQQSWPDGLVYTGWFPKYVTN